MGSLSLGLATMATMARMRSLVVVLILAATSANLAKDKGTCNEGEEVKLQKRLKMVCNGGTWQPEEPKGRSKFLGNDRANPGGPPCTDTALLTNVRLTGDTAI